jgi:hypothetical protein
VWRGMCAASGQADEILPVLDRWAKLIPQLH